MMLSAATHCAGGTRHCAAAAAINISRAVAPARRRYSCDDAMERLAPVEVSPQIRFFMRLWRGETNSVRTLLQSHASSSATSMARPVIAPCPISERATRIVTVSSGAIAIQQLISGARIGGARRRIGERNGKAQRQAAGRRAGADKQ